MAEQIKLYTVHDKEFKEYGNVLECDSEEIRRAAARILPPEDGSRYLPSVAEFENMEIKKVMQNEVFGGMSVQMGYCWGRNNRLNALEWHKSSEINIAVTDFILLLGRVCDISEDLRYASENVTGFLVKAGEAVEVYATSLHFCPCETSKDGFGAVVVLPGGTNTQLDYKPKDRLLFARNKWLICHEDNKALTNKGAYGGIYGENYTV